MAASMAVMAGESNSTPRLTRCAVRGCTHLCPIYRHGVLSLPQPDNSVAETWNPPIFFAA
jgi:hypothetical protein